MKLQLALREIIHNKRFSGAYIVNLSLGLFGFLLINSFSHTVQENFQARSRALLTADLAVSARRSFTPEEEALLDQATKDQAAATRTIELYSMMATPQGSRLVELIAIEENYPLIGEIQLESQGGIRSETPKRLVSRPEIWIAPELSVQMNLHPGDSAKLGNLDFRVSDQIKVDSGASWRGFSLAPRLYLGVSQLKKTGLIRLGSTLSYRRFFRFNSEGSLEKAFSLLNQQLRDPGIQITTHRKAGEQMGRMMAYLSDYLGLVALVGLFLAALGSTYLFHSFISRRLGEIATLISLGLPHFEAIQIYVIQIILLGLSSVILATLATLASLPLAQKVLAQYLAFSIELKLPLAPLFTTLMVGLGASLLVCFPLLMRIRILKPSLLFQESQTQDPHLNLKIPFRSAANVLPAFLFFYFLSVWQSHSWRIGSLFFFGLCGSGLLLVILVGLGLLVLGRIKIAHRSLAVKLASRYLVHNPVSTTAIFLAVGLGAVLMNFLPQTQKNIQSEINIPEGSRLPSLFLFDIQEEQIESLKAFLSAEKVAISQISLMVRARLISINGKTFEKTTGEKALSTREEEQDARMRNRGFNLTTRETLSKSETLTEGRPFQGHYDGTSVPEISVEEKYAKTLGVQLEDVLTFDIQGVNVAGKIVSLRKVKWNSFQPNFFIQFQPGVLDDAPKTYLATLEKLTPLDRARIQNLLVQTFPNVSMIDVSAIIQALMSLVSQMIWAIQVMALLVVATGLIVLFSIASHQARTRRKEVQLLKILGGQASFISQTHWIEFGGIGFLASLLGVGISLVLSWTISVILFDSAWDFSWNLPAATVLGITFLTLITTTLAVRGTIQEKPASLLGDP